ncbi:MAG: hypothetical protein ABIN89_19010 [Chitinophagaceae bacterium]
MNKPPKKMPDPLKSEGDLPQGTCPAKPINDEDPTIMQTPLRRRKFLGMGLFGFAGLALPSIPVRAQTATGKLNGQKAKMATGPEKTYWDRTEPFEEKVKLLQSAWDRKDFRAVRALTDSLRNTTIQAQAEDENPGTPLSASSQYGKVESLPGTWKTWAKGWSYYKTLAIAGTEAEKKMTKGKPILGYPLTATPTDQFITYEPIEVLLSFPSDQVSSLSREIRVARVEAGVLKEVTSQVFGELRRGKELFCQLLFMAESLGVKKQTFLIFYGNPDAELPGYPTDLVTTGEGFGLDIENDFFKVSLSKQHGQIERMVLKREHGLNIYAGGDGHGEPAGIDWAHDYVTEGSFQKLRVSLWDKCPDYEVVRGPICTIVRRWGFPYSPVHPLFSPSRLNVDVEYRFFAGLPYFQKSAHMTALKNFDLAALRDDEWVFTGQSFTDMMWMGPDGKLKIGEVDKDFSDNLWGIGFFNKDNRDSFVGLFLEHRAEGMPEPRHSGSPTLYYKWHGSVWSRYPVYGKEMPAGAVLHEKNVYVTLPFTTTEGPAMIEELRHRLKNPLGVLAGTIQNDAEAKESAGRLARPGEAGDSLIPKKLLWDALRDCKDPQFYTADISIVDLGLVYDITVRGDVVKVLLAMPHRGRPLATYFTNGSNSVHNKVSMNIHDALRRVPGVREVIMEQPWYPGWSSNLLTEEGRQKLGI